MGIWERVWNIAEVTIWEGQTMAAVLGVGIFLNGLGRAWRWRRTMEEHWDDSIGTAVA